MKTRLLYGSGILALTILVTLVVWQGSFTLGDYGPGDPTQTSLYWAVSTLVFILTLTIGFMLFRTGVKLYIERRSNREGSRIRTKMVVGALALSFMPVFFLVLWSVSLLNRNLEKWFSRPAEGIVLELRRAEQALRGEVQGKARLQADWLAGLPQTQEYLRTGVPPVSFFARACRDNGIVEAHLVRADGSTLSVCPPSPGAGEAVDVRTPVPGPAKAAALVLRSRIPIDLARSQRVISSYLAEYDASVLDKKTARSFYLRFLTLLTLFILFVATWITLFLARQISVPISALLEAAGQI